MHNALLGVTKLFLTEWFDGKNKNQDWYLGRKINTFNHRLLNICPPTEITRTPQSIQNRAYWKASEYRSFMLYYSLLCLQGLLPNKYLQHWMLFCSNMYTFLLPKIEKEDFYAAKFSLEQFVRDIEFLYDRRFYKYNIHLLTHVPQTVKIFGSLWNSSAFIFEHYNGILSKMFHSSNGVPLQICQHYLTLRRLEEFSRNVFSDKKCTEDVKYVYRKLLNHYYDNLTFEDDHDTYNDNTDQALKLFHQKEIKLDLTLKVCIENYLHIELKSDDAYSCSRCIYKNVLWHANAKNALRKRLNSIAQLSDGSFIILNRILTVEQQFQVIEGVPLEVYKSLNYNSRVKDIHFFVRKTKSIRIISFQLFYRKCVLIPLCTNNEEECENENFLLIPLVNPFERD